MGQLPLFPDAPGPRRQLYAADAFAGAGLFALGFALEGVRIGESCELDPHAAKTLTRMIHDQEVHTCDVRKWSPRVPKGGIDVLFGGPPCQPFSRLGKRKGAADPRFLLDEFTRWMRESRPRVVVLENVRGLLEKKHRWIVKRWFKEAAEAGYEGAIWSILAADYGTPQLRPRVMLCAWPIGAPWGPHLRNPPPPTHAPPDVAAKLGLLPWTSAHERMVTGCCGGYALYSCAWLNDAAGMCDTCDGGDNYQMADNEVAADDRRRREVQLPADHPFFPGATYLAGAEKDGELSLGEVAMLLRDPHRIRSRHPPVNLSQMPVWDRRRKTLWLAPTSTASIAKGVPMGLMVEPGAIFDTGASPSEYHGVRHMTVREVAKLMDVPNWYVFEGPVRSQYRQIGNGVPVNVARAVARHVLRAFGRKVPQKDTYAASPHSGLWPFGDENGCRGYVRKVDDPHKLVSVERLKRRLT